MTTIYLPEAEAEMHEAAQFYENERKQLGNRFYDVISRALEDIELHPRKSPQVRNAVRRRLLPKFPYAILYLIHHDEVVVVAVAHLHRDPLYWLERLESL